MAEITERRNQLTEQTDLERLSNKEIRGLTDDRPRARRIQAERQHAGLIGFRPGTFNHRGAQRLAGENVSTPDSGAVETFFTLATENAHFVGRGTSPTRVDRKPRERY
jgi:hypothetical protein